MKHLDLFSGIGGFALAADEVWGKENITHTFCDNDQFCQKVLSKHWPQAKIYQDIRTLTYDDEQRRYRQEHGIPNATVAFGRERPYQIDFLTGGFPCQPFSQAGRRKGTNDDRYLWPEMLRVIREFKPRWVIGENVAGLLTIEHGVVFEQVCADLEAEGYEVQPFIIPAVAVNAPHRRDRVWIVAHRTSERPDAGERDREERHVSADERIAAQSESKRQGRKRGAGEVDTAVNNAVGKRSGRRVESSGQILERRSPQVEDARSSWEENWLEVATELCGMDDGLPARMDGLELTKAQYRVQRLKALGNSIVPQVAIEIMRAIKAQMGE